MDRMSTVNFKRQQILFSSTEIDSLGKRADSSNCEKVEWRQIRQEAGIHLELESAGQGGSSRLHSLSLLHPLLLILCIIPMAGLMGCHSNDYYKPSPSSNVPFANNVPKTKEEEAYYRDVYSGEWKEQINPFGFGKAIGKKNGSTSMPSHWAMIPDGAKSMSEMRAENSARQMAQSNQMPGNQMPGNQAPYNQSQYIPYSGVPQGYQQAPQNTSVNGNVPGAYMQYGTAPAPIAVAQNGSVPYTPNAGNGYQNGSVYNQNVVPGNNVVPVNNGTLNLNNNSVPVSENVIIRGQVPLRSRMRDLYFAEEPVRVAQASVPAGADKILPADANINKEESNKEGSNKEGGVSDQRIGGQVRVLKVDPKLVDPNHKTPAVLPQSSFQKVIGNPANKGGYSKYEYITDGGDRKGEAYSSSDWKVHHLDTEDTIAHFDTVDGKILVEPSNRVQIYSPRFGTVRQVLGPESNQSNVTLVDAQGKIKVAVDNDITGADIRSAENAASMARDDKMVAGTQADAYITKMESEEFVMEESLKIRIGDMVSLLKSSTISDKERPILMEGANAAQAWGELQKVAVDIDSLQAHSNVYNQGAEVLYTVETKTKTSRLSLIKIASKKSAQPGELIEFTLRYQNIGQETIGNVTILDNLSSRLEYVDASAKSSRKGEFLTETNEVGSLILRWEISEPLQKGEFGIIQFLCRVR